MLKHARSLLYLCLTTALSTQTAVSNPLELPDIGTTASSTLTIAQEIQYGDAYMRTLRSHSPIINDPVLNEYIDNLGHRLVAHASDVKTPFTFFMINDANINAFAFFGGHVALNSGLFLHAQSESELASVVAHEIAHVTQRHLARSMEDEARRSPATIAAIAGSLLLAIAVPQAGIAAISATTASTIQGKINHTRSSEKEADRFGMSTLAKSGFDVNAMPRFFGRLAAEYRYASKLPPMLLTHPLPESRMTDSRARAQSYPAHRVTPSLSYHLARSRVVARYANINAAQALDWMRRKQKRAPKKIAAAFQYGKALIYLDNNQLDKALILLRGLLELDANNRFYLDAMSDLYIAQTQANKAEKMLSQALRSAPHNSVLTINYANVLLKQNKNAEAIKVLQRYTHDHPDDVNGWDLLSQANIHLGLSGEDLAARGEILALEANWNKAIQYYTQASQIAELGSLNQARYDARIDQLIIQRDRFLALQ